MNPINPTRKPARVSTIPGSHLSNHTLRTGLASLLSVAVLIGCASTAVQWQPDSGPRPSVLILGQDHEHGSVPSSSRPFQRFIGEANQVLIDHGHLVYDANIVLPVDAMHRTRETGAELIDMLGEHADAQADVLVLIALQAQVNTKDNAQIVRLQASGTLLDTATGREISTLEPGDGVHEWSVSPSCDRTCIMEELGDKARDLGGSVGVMVSERLQQRLSSHRFGKQPLTHP